jgi:hypothetical protein
MLLPTYFVAILVEINHLVEGHRPKLLQHRSAPGMCDFLAKMTTIQATPKERRSRSNSFCTGKSLNKARSIG